MKRLILTEIATVAVALGALAQSIVNIDDFLNTNGVAIDRPGNYYSGTFGMEVWDLCPPPSGSALATLLSGINSAPSATVGYDAMVGDGFKLQNADVDNKGITFTDSTMVGGTFSLGRVFLYNAIPSGSTVVLALAVWNTATSSWASMLATADANTRAGVIAFVNPTVYISTTPPVAPTLTGWTTSIGDLVMTAIPEPSTLSLVGLGVAALLLFRHRK